ncbi:hypothetical protein [Aquimarina rhabdastrellae]
MKYLSYLSFVLILGCTASKKANTASSDVVKEEAINYEKEGYKKGNIVINKTGGCPYVLTVESYKDVLDPINLTDFFKSNVPYEVWIKYSDLRMKNRCDAGRPVMINSIKRR